MTESTNRLPSSSTHSKRRTRNRPRARVHSRAKQNDKLHKHCKLVHTRTCFCHLGECTATGVWLGIETEVFIVRLSVARSMSRIISARGARVTRAISSRVGCKDATRSLTRCYSSSDGSAIEDAKRTAATAAVAEYFVPGCRIGIGSGSTIVYAVQELAKIFAKRDKTFTCVPTSFQAQQLIVEAGLNLSDLSRTPQLDVVIDGADEVDAALNCIKGGGGCLLQEKVVAACTETFVLIADHRKQSTVSTSGNVGFGLCCGLNAIVITRLLGPTGRKVSR